MENSKQMVDYLQPIDKLRGYISYGLDSNQVDRLHINLGHLLDYRKCIAERMCALHYSHKEIDNYVELEKEMDNILKYTNDQIRMLLGL